MITLLAGENSFEIERNLAQICDDFDGRAEKIDGSSLELSSLPDILMGSSLFSEKRLVIIRNFSENKLIWPVFGDWISKISDDINLVLVESKLDKRTSTYKTLKKEIVVREFEAFNDRDIYKVESWVGDEAKKMGVKMDKNSIQYFVRRVGFDQWALFNALQKLSMLDEITEENIKETIEPNEIENVFDLFEIATKGDINQLQQKINILKKTQDEYMLFALISSQVFQLAAISSASDSDNASKDFGIHPFVASKLEQLARKIGPNKITKIVEIFVKADIEMKTSATDPWLIIEKSLYKIASLD